MIKPGLVVQYDSEANGTEIAIANLPDGRILCGSGHIFELDELMTLDEMVNEFLVSHIAYRVLLNEKLMAPSFEELQVGDGVLLSKKTAKLAVVGFLYKPSEIVLTTEGEIVELNSPDVSLTGWHTEDCDLTNFGKAIFWSLF